MSKITPTEERIIEEFDKKFCENKSGWRKHLKKTICENPHCSREEMIDFISSAFSTVRSETEERVRRETIEECACEIEKVQNPYKDNIANIGFQNCRHNSAYVVRSLTGLNETK